MLYFMPMPLLTGVGRHTTNIIKIFENILSYVLYAILGDAKLISKLMVTIIFEN